MANDAIAFHDDGEDIIAPLPAVPDVEKPPVTKLRSHGYRVSEFVNDAHRMLDACLSMLVVAHVVAIASVVTIRAIVAKAVRAVHACFGQGPHHNQDVDVLAEQKLPNHAVHVSNGQFTEGFNDIVLLGVHAMHVIHMRLLTQGS